MKIYKGSDNFLLFQEGTTTRKGAIKSGDVFEHLGDAHYIYIKIFHYPSMQFGEIEKTILKYSEGI